MAEKMSISFVLPVLSETAALRTTVETIMRLASDEVHEILIVLAEHSRRTSAATAEQLRDELPEVVRIHRQKLPGLGGAVREAFTLAGGTHVMLMAADLETDPEEIPRFIERMRQGDCDVVAGSRWISGGSFQGYNRTKLVANWGFQKCLQAAFASRLTDLTFAYRLYRREAIEGIRWEKTGHPMLLECLLKPLRLGARVVEIPCRWRCREEGLSGGSLLGTLAYVPMAMRLRLLPKSDLIESGDNTHEKTALGRHALKLLLLIFAVALLLRLGGAWRANLIFDERAHLALAETINFQPGQVNLVSRTLDHPLLSIYVLKLSSMIFGDSNFGLRILHVLAGAITVVPVFFLGRRVFGERAGLLAAALLSVDQFHASWSRVFMPEVLMLLFVALVLLQMLRALEAKTARSYALLGLLLGLAYLAKEPAVLLLPSLWIFLLITPRHRGVLLDPRWYLAHVVCVLVVAPDVIWNLLQSTDSYLYRDANILAEPWRLSLKPLSLYIGELFRMVVGPDVLDKEYAQGNVYACYWIAGVIYLAAAIWLAITAFLGRTVSSGERLLWATFVVTSTLFFVLPGGEMFEPFWWASISLVPAAAFGGRLLDRIGETGKPAMVVVVMLLVFLGGHYVGAIRHPGRYEPRATAQDFANDFIARAFKAIEQGDLHEAQGRFIYALNIGGPNADAYSGLAEVALRRENTDKARALAKKALALDPGHAGAVELMGRMERH